MRCPSRGLQSSVQASWAQASHNGSASHGVHVVLSDISTEALSKGMKRIRDLTDEATKRRVLSRKEGRETMDRISLTHQPVPLHGCQLVIEAATEDMDLKKKIFTGLAACCGPDTILATNTSALSVAELAQHVPHPERVIGLHFFNPVHRMGLIEVVALPETKTDVLATAYAFVQRLGRTPVVMKDSPGFVVKSRAHALPDGGCEAVRVGTLFRGHRRGHARLRHAHGSDAFAG